MSRPLWGHPVGHDDPACRGRATPCVDGEPPTKVGGLREDILFESKEYPLALPKKDSGRDFEFPSQTLLETTKGRAAALPLETIPGLQGIGGWGPAGDEGRGRFAARLRGTLGRGTEDGGFGACGHSEHFVLRKTRAMRARQISNRHWVFVALSLCVFPSFL